MCMVLNKRQEKLMKDEAFDFDLEEMEAMLSQELEESFSDLHFLEKERKKISNPDTLGEVIQSAVWEQFMNQIALTAGEDFIKENNNLTLDLRKDAHIQTTENFTNGNIATHNTKIDYQKRYDDWQANFQRENDGTIKYHDTRTGKQEPVLQKGARERFDKNRPTGSVEKKTDMDHTISAAEMTRDPATNAHMSQEEQVAFANSDVNLKEMDSSLNRSKGDKSMSDWLDNPNSKGQKPHEIFDISEEDDKRMRRNDEEAREAHSEKVKKGEKEAIETGKQSRKEEGLRIGGKALRAIVMQLLADLMKEMIAKLVKWFKATKRSFNSLLDNFKEAIHSFVGKLNKHLLNAGNTLLTTIASAIYGPIVGTFKKMWIFLKQGWKSLKEAIAYIKEPDNKGKSLDHLMLEVGKIITAGLTVGGAIVLGEAIEKGLTTIPIFAISIPLIGSLASVIGIFLGALVSGIIGAIVLQQIDKFIARKLEEDATKKLIEKKNEILEKQSGLNMVVEQKVANRKEEVLYAIIENHAAAKMTMDQSLEKIHQEVTAVHSKEDQQALTEEFDKMRKELDGLI